METQEQGCLLVWIEREKMSRREVVRWGNGRGGEGEMESRIVRSNEESGVVERGSSGEV